MSMFFQLRIALSPAIEAIILLDRCLWLLEQVVIDLRILATCSMLNEYPTMHLFGGPMHIWSMIGY